MGGFLEHFESKWSVDVVVKSLPFLRVRNLSDGPTCPISYIGDVGFRRG